MIRTALDIRTMTEADIPAILKIQAVSYTELVPESDESLRAKLIASPATCLIARLGDGVVGYLISLPWERAKPPVLNALTCQLPLEPNCLYLHDLAVTTSARNSGAGRALVDTFLTQLRVLNLGHASLIAVQGSAPYWQRYGFLIVELSEPFKAKLSTYGKDVVYMELEKEN